MATIASEKLTRAVKSVLNDMMGSKRGQLAPSVSASWHQIREAAALIQPTVWSEYQKLVANKVRVEIDASEEPAMACLKGQHLKPYKVLGEGVHGTVWLTKRSNGKSSKVESVVKVGNVELDNHPTVTRHYDRARREFAISKAAGELGVSPKVFDSFFCCANDDSCYYVIVMEYVEGVDLRTWKNGATPESIDQMRLKMLEKTRILREAGIEHYDLHEGNVIVTPYEDPIIIDFSLAQWINISDFDDDEDSVQRIFSKTQTVDQIVKAHILKSDMDASLKSPAVGSRKTGATGSRKSGAAGSIKTSSLGSIKSTAFGSRKSGAVGSRKSGAVGSRKSGAAVVSSKSGAVGSRKSGAAVVSSKSSTVGSSSKTAVDSLKKSTVLKALSKVKTVSKGHTENVNIAARGKLLKLVGMVPAATKRLAL